MKHDDWVRTQHMFEAATEAVSFARGSTRDSLKQDRKLALALVKCIEILGEAAAKVSEESRRDHPQIPWVTIVAMRNRLIHAYFDIDLDRVWDTITDDLPPLVAQLEKIVRSKNGEP